MGDVLVDIVDPRPVESGQYVPITFNGPDEQDATSYTAYERNQRGGSPLRSRESLQGQDSPVIEGFRVVYPESGVCWQAPSDPVGPPIPVSVLQDNCYGLKTPILKICAVTPWVVFRGCYPTIADARNRVNARSVDPKNSCYTNEPCVYWTRTPARKLDSRFAAKSARSLIAIPPFLRCMPESRSRISVTSYTF